MAGKCDERAFAKIFFHRRSAYFSPLSLSFPLLFFAGFLFFTFFFLFFFPVSRFELFGLLIGFEVLECRRIIPRQGFSTAYRDTPFEYTISNRSHDRAKKFFSPNNSLTQHVLVPVLSLRSRLFLSKRKKKSCLVARWRGGGGREQDRDRPRTCPRLESATTTVASPSEKASASSNPSSPPLPLKPN